MCLILCQFGFINIALAFSDPVQSKAKDDIGPECLELIASLDEVEKEYFKPIIKQAVEQIKATEDCTCFFVQPNIAQTKLKLQANLRNTAI